MSQRLVSFLIVVAMFVIGGAVAWTQHVLPPLDDIGANLLTFAVPIVGVFVTLKTWFDVLDSKVADGSLAPNDLMAMFATPAFITYIVACAAGVIQSYGFKVLDANTQTFIVDSALVLINVLFRSFTNRTPGATLNKTQVQSYTFQRLSAGASSQTVKAELVNLNQ